MPTTTPTAPTGAPASRPRLEVLDGLRGIAIVLVVLSHGWVLWPTEWYDARPWIQPVFRSGNTAVTVFLVASGFLTYRALAGRGGLEAMRPGVTLLRRVLRVGPSLWLMLAVLMLVAVVDPTDRTKASDNVASVGHVLSYTWNWYVQHNLVTSRPDFGHLWYLSVDMQAFVVTLFVLWRLRHRPLGLVAVLSGLLLLLTWWRMHVADTEYVFVVLVRTTARMDPFVAGVLAAAVAQLVRRHDVAVDRRTMTQVATGAAVLLLPLWWFCVRDERFLGWGVTLLELDLAALVLAVYLGATTARRPLRTLTARPLTFLGRHSLLLYIWHYPIWVFVERHTTGWDWWWRTVVGLVAVMVLCVLADRLLERRVTRLLRSPRWHAVDAGLWPALVALPGRVRARRRARREVQQESQAGEAEAPGAPLP